MSIDEKLDLILGEIGGLKSKVDSMENEMTLMKGNVISIENEMASMKGDITSMKLTIENEITRNIKVVAEGHYDLTRKLDDVLKTEAEKEMLLVRMNVAEGDIRRLNEKIERIAFA